MLTAYVGEGTVGSCKQTGSERRASATPGEESRSVDQAQRGRVHWSRIQFNCRRASARLVRVLTFVSINTLHYNSSLVLSEIK